MAARAQIEALLRARRLDVTLTTAAPLAGASRPSASTGLAWLDGQMAGGWPRGESSEIVGPASSGRTAVLCATFAAATARGEIVALVDALDCFDPQSASAVGIELSQMLWARGESMVRVEAFGRRRPAPRRPAPRRPAPCRSVRAPDSGDWPRKAAPAPASTASASQMARAVDRALKAFGLVLQAGGFGVVALDLGEVPARTIAGLPFTTWMRLQRVIEGSGVIALIIAPEPVSRSARGVSLRLAADPARTPVWDGGSDRSRRLAGLALAPAVAASRRLDEVMPVADASERRLQ